MKNLHSTAARWLAVTVSCALALLVQSSAHATTATPYFTNLVTELQARSTALTGTTNKLAKTQKKAIDAALKSITTAHGTTVVAAIVVAHDVAKAVMVTATKNVTLAPMDSAPRRRAMALVIPTGVTPVRRVKIHPADFLRVVWAARDDDQKIIAYVRHCAGNDSV